MDHNPHTLPGPLSKDSSWKSNSCDQCSRRKVKCSRSRPACESCKEANRVCTYSLTRAVGRPRRRLSPYQGRDENRHATAHTSTHAAYSNSVSRRVETKAVREQAPVQSPSHILGLDTMLDLQHENEMGPLDDSEDFDFHTFSNLGGAISSTFVGNHQSQDLTRLENPATALSGETSATKFPVLTPSALQMEKAEDGAGPHSSEPRISPSCQCTQNVLGSTSKLMSLRNHAVLLAGGAHRADKGVHSSYEEFHDANKVIVRFAMCEKPHSISESMMALSLLQLMGEKLVDEGSDTPWDSESDGLNHSSASLERNLHDMREYSTVSGKHHYTLIGSLKAATVMHLSLQYRPRDRLDNGLHLQLLQPCAAQLKQRFEILIGKTLDE